MSRRGSAAAWGFAAVLLLAAFHDLGGRSLDQFDTARWGQLAREMVRSGEWLVPTRYGELYVNKPPLYLWLVAGPARVFGEVTPFLVRLPSALGLLLLVLSSAAWMRWRTGSAQAGRYAALLLLSTFGVAWMGRSGRLDMLGAGVSVAAAALLDRAALGRGTRRTPWLAGVLLGAALLVKGPPLLLAPAAVLLVPSAGRTLRMRLRAARPLLVLGVAAGLALLWFVPAVLTAGWDDYGRKLLVGQAAERLSGTLDQTLPPWHYLLGLPTFFAPWGILYLALAVGVWVPRVRRALGPVAGVALAGSLVLLLFSLVPTKHDRYLVPLVPLFALPLAWCVVRWLARPARANWSRHVRLLAAGCAIVALALVVAGFVVRPLALLPLLVPAVALLVLAVVSWRGDADADPRTRFVTSLLLALTLAVLALSVARPRCFDSRKEEFNRQLAALRTEETPVWIVRGLEPENVFHGAPEARYWLDPAEPVPLAPGGRLLVVCRRADADRLHTAAGVAGRIFTQDGDPIAWTIVGFGYP